MTDIQMTVREINKEFNTQQLAEICFHVIKTILRYVSTFRIPREHLNEICQVIKALKKYLHKLSLSGINLLQVKPCKDILLISLICNQTPGERDIENLRLSLIEINLNNLSRIHPRLCLDFLDSFMQESMKSLRLKWKYVPAHVNLPTLCSAKIRSISTTLHQRLKVLNLDHLSYSSNVTFTILKVI
jgi:hypothetical protein